MLRRSRLAHRLPMKKPYHYYRDSSLILDLRFNENTGIVETDLSDSANNGTLTGGATWHAGRNGYAVKLDGTNGMIAIGDTTALDLRARGTVFMHCYFPITWTRGDGYKGMISKESVNKAWELILHSIQGIELRLNGGGVCACFSAKDITKIGWYHIGFTFDNAANTGKIYMNNVCICTIAACAGDPTASGADVRVGYTYGASGYSIAGLVIDEVKIWNRVLPANEIAVLANEFKSLA